MYLRIKDFIMKKRFLSISVVFIPILLIVLVLVVINRGFRVTGYSPSLSNMSTVTPYLDIDFSLHITTKNLHVYSPESIVSSYKLQSSDILRVYFNIPFAVNTTYSVVIGSISSTSGNTIQNYSFSFKPTYTNQSSV